MTARTDNYGWTSEVMESSGYLNPALRKLVRAASPVDVLDAGCGNGTLAGELATDGYTVVGVDGDPGGIAVARTKYPDVRFEVGLFEGNPLSMQATSDGRFDYVVSTEVVEHLYSPHELARYCFEALRPGGRLAMSTPYHGYAKNLALSIFNKWDEHHTVWWHGGHVKFWSRKTLNTLLEDAGFTITGFVGVGRVPLLWKSMIVLAEKPRETGE